jgi:hypothetical protein
MKRSLGFWFGVFGFAPVALIQSVQRVWQSMSDEEDLFGSGSSGEDSDSGQEENVADIVVCVAVFRRVCAHCRCYCC